jgi:GNAT superfamily N-acetyltransferase
MTIFTRTDSDNADFHALVSLLDIDLAMRDGDEHNFYAQFNKIQNLQHVVVCYADETPIGCGAFKEYETDSIEIKRMFVLSKYRGHGIGLKVLNELELWAAELDYTACVLETGKKQLEAIELYLKAGYTIINKYRQYENLENSICMRKSLNV